ncbi:ABC transporter permease subunit [Paenibacillus sp. strain BS8-2]
MKSSVQTQTSSISSRYGAVLGKELLELTRSMKLVFVPLIFVALGIMQPVSIYYMPFILENAGNLPEGAIIDIPPPEASQVMANTLSQFGVLGLLVIVLVFMGIVSGERTSGTASLILVKPVSVSAFLGAKWSSMLLLAWLSLLAGYGAAWYYTTLLIGSFPFDAFIRSAAVYGLWLAFVMSVTLLFSTMLRSPAAAAFCTLGLMAALSLTSGLLPKYLSWSPGSLSGFAYQETQSALERSDMLLWSIVITIVLIAAVFAITYQLLRRATAID